MSASRPARINLKLRELSQLFNSMDPSPFLDRDLDDDAEEFIVSSARELHARACVRTHRAPRHATRRRTDGGTEHAVQHYFAARAELKHREFRLLLRRGHSVLSIGLLFLTSCLVPSGLATKLVPDRVGDILRERLIVGWVATWRPLEIYLYDWWPLRQEWLGLQRLAKMRVRVVHTPPKTADRTAGAVPQETRAQRREDAEMPAPSRVDAGHGGLA